MTATIARKGSASGRQPANNASNAAETDGRNTGGLVFTVKATKHVAPKRGGREATVVIPNTVMNAYDAMLAENPVGVDNDTMQSVTTTLTNEQITQWLKSGLTKLVRRNPDPTKRHVDWVKNSVVTAEGSPNAQSAGKDDKAKNVTIVWTVRYRSEDEYRQLIADRQRRADAKAGA